MLDASCGYTVRLLNYRKLDAGIQLDYYKLQDAGCGYTVRLLNYRKLDAGIQ